MVFVVNYRASISIIRKWNINHNELTNMAGNIYIVLWQCGMHSMNSKDHVKLLSVALFIQTLEFL